MGDPILHSRNSRPWNGQNIERTSDTVLDGPWVIQELFITDITSILEVRPGTKTVSE